MRDIFTKYYMDELGILIYTHFRGNYAVRQIDISEDKVVFLSEEKPVQGNDMLYDGKFDELEVNENEFISKEEFENQWKKQRTS